MTVEELKDTWRRRDAMYHERRTHGAPALTPDEEETVRRYREMEVKAHLDNGSHERAEAMTFLNHWQGPRGR